MRLYCHTRFKNHKFRKSQYHSCHCSKVLLVTGIKYLKWSLSLWRENALLYTCWFQVVSHGGIFSVSFLFSLSFLIYCLIKEYKKYVIVKNRIYSDPLVTGDEWVISSNTVVFRIKKTTTINEIKFNFNFNDIHQ